MDPKIKVILTAGAVWLAIGAGTMTFVAAATGCVYFRMVRAKTARPILSTVPVWIFGFVTGMAVTYMTAREHLGIIVAAVNYPITGWAFTGILFLGSAMALLDPDSTSGAAMLYKFAAPIHEAQKRLMAKNEALGLHAKKLAVIVDYLTTEADQDVGRILFESTKPDGEFWTWETMPEKRRQAYTAAAHRAAVNILIKSETPPLLDNDTEPRTYRTLSTPPGGWNVS